MALMMVAGSVVAQGTPLHDPIPPHDTFTVVSQALGETRTVNVHTPAVYASSSTQRFPTLYMPDGGLDEDFPHVVNTVDSLIALGKIRPVMIIGIPNTERRRDLAGPTRIATDSAIAPRVGRSEAFRCFLKDELIPAVQSRYRTTSERAIVGESLAGLFVVETLLTESALFDHYVALDPSLWWNSGALVDSAPARIGAFDSRPRSVFFATSNVADIAAPTARLDSLLKSSLPRGLSAVYLSRPDLTHATIFRALGPDVWRVRSDKRSWATRTLPHELAESKSGQSERVSTLGLRHLAKCPKALPMLLLFRQELEKPRIAA